MNGESAGHAVLFTGDTNLGLDDPDDVPLLDQWISEAGLTDSCAAAACPEADHIDRIFLRDGPGVRWRVEAWEREVRFVDAAGVDLSDHPPIRASLSWR